MKFGGTSVADAERIKRAARRIVDKRELGHACRAVAVARARADRRPDRDAEEVSDAPHPREMDMLLSTASASPARCARWRSTTSATRDLADGLPSRNRDRRSTPRRASSMYARTDQRRWRRTASCSSPAFRASRARRATSPRSGAAARTRRGCRRGGARGGGVRDLLRRLRRVHGDPRIVADARKARDRSPSRRCSRWRPRAPACCSCDRRVRAQPRRAHPLPLVIRGGPGTVSSQRRKRWSSR